MNWGWWEEVMIVMFSILRLEELSWFWRTDSKVVGHDVLMGIDGEIVIKYVSVRSDVSMNGDGWLPKILGSNDIWLVRFFK